MDSMYVAVESLNLRSSPGVEADNRIGSLYLTQPVVALADAGEWLRCSAEVEGARKEGFVAKKFLRPPLTANREALIASVSREYMRFGHGLGKEWRDPYFKYVGEMWQAIGLNLDGRDRDQPGPPPPSRSWSGTRGTPTRTSGSRPSHSKYVHQAIRARLDNDASVPFWGFRLDEVRPRIGDIVARDNPEFGPVVTYDVAASLDSYRSHTDIIVHIDSEKQRALAIGGNVGQSVAVAVYDLAAGDFLDDTRNTFAILRNITDDAAAPVWRERTAAGLRGPTPRDRLLVGSQAQLSTMSRRTNAVQASSSAVSTYSSALWARSIRPGPITTDGTSPRPLEQAGLGPVRDLGVAVAAGEALGEGHDRLVRRHVEARIVEERHGLDAAGGVDPGHLGRQLVAREGDGGLGERLRVVGRDGAELEIDALQRSGTMLSALPPCTIADRPVVWGTS